VKCLPLLIWASVACLDAAADVSARLPERHPVRQSLSREIVGDLRLHEFRSRVFDNTRTLRVLVPDGYDAEQNGERRYPVLYLNDGQNLFDASTSVLNRMEWRVDETVRELTSAGRIAPMIVVGIDSAGRRGRFREYFPYVDAYLRPPEPNPQGKRYPAFLVDEVIPYIEARYRVEHRASSRGLGGSSAGALAAMFTVIDRPGVFGRLLIESPSIYVDDAHILRDAAHAASWPERIYLGVGTNERGQPACDPKDLAEPELVRDVRRFERLLREARVDAARIRVVITPCAVHDEAAWAARLPEALTFLYGSNSVREGRRSTSLRSARWTQTKPHGCWKPRSARFAMRRTNGSSDASARSRSAWKEPVKTRRCISSKSASSGTVGRGATFKCSAP
jgi:predicted alpha/beta superfamily hydrolase